MKIAINGSLIETEHIYEITKITFDNWGHLHFTFEIKLFNDKIITIKKSSNCYIGDKHDSKNPEHRVYTTVGESRGDRTYREVIESDVYHDALEEIVNFRNKILNVWSNNQLKIPQFNITND